ncbi:MAG: hypothetical protein A2103_05625 [Gammaproteobacteria bacterium GWF2_41_13]|nr:MAG: hypothetical protein A2103_05625 [Gammaproteobacteria bacterium GWF2_41_13]
MGKRTGFYINAIVAPCDEFVGAPNLESSRNFGHPQGVPLQIPELKITIPPQTLFFYFLSKTDVNKKDRSIDVSLEKQ